MIRAVIIVLCLFAVCPKAARGAPRVVSLDYCADQFVLKLAAPEQIAGLSLEADNDYSYMRRAVSGKPQIRPVAEDILLLKPDLVLRHWGGDAGTMRFFARFGIPVMSIAYTVDLSGVRTNILAVAKALGRERKGEKLAAEFDARLARIDAVLARVPERDRPEALYLTSSGFTSGSGTMIDDLMRAAGLVNSAAGAGRSGWFPVPLEDLVRRPPDFVAAGFFDTLAARADYWSLSRHPVMRRILAKAHTEYLTSTVLTCPAWFVLDAVEQLHAAAYSRRSELLMERDD